MARLAFYRRYIKLTIVILLLPRFLISLKSIGNAAAQAPEIVRTLVHADEPRLGEERSMPPTPHEVVQMVRRRNLVAYSISSGIENQVLFQRRITEGCWPARLESEASDHFSLVGQPIDERCKVMETGKRVVYSVCH